MIEKDFRYREQTLIGTEWVPTTWASDVYENVQAKLVEIEGRTDLRIWNYEISQEVV